MKGKAKAQDGGKVKRVANTYGTVTGLNKLAMGGGDAKKETSAKKLKKGC